MTVQSKPAPLHITTTPHLLRRKSANDSIAPSLCIANHFPHSQRSRPKSSAEPTTTSSPVTIQSAPLQPSRSKSANEGRNEDVRLVFNKTIGGHYRHGKTGYTSVGVLCLTWKDDDMQCKETEVDFLRDLFKDGFKFETECFEIPSERCQTALQKRLSEFCWRYDRSDCLAILYYGGHGYEGTGTGKFKLSAKFGPDGDGDPSVFFSDILGCLQQPACDQLVILDCCYAARAFTRDYPGGRRKFELLTSAAADAQCPAPVLPGSFTKTLNECLRSLLKDYPEGFSTSHLFRETYHAIDKIKPVHFDHARHNYGKIWLRPQIPLSKSDSGGNGTYLHLTLRLNEEPDPAIMNELASSLQFLPHVNQVRYDHLYAPKGTLDNFMSAVFKAKKLRPLVKRLQENRLSNKAEALKHGDHREPLSPSLVKRLLKQKDNPLFDWSRTEMHRDPTQRSGTWPPAETEKPSKMRLLSKRLPSVQYKPDVIPGGALVLGLFFRRVNTIGCSPSQANVSASSIGPPTSFDQPTTSNEDSARGSGGPSWKRPFLEYLLLILVWSLILSALALSHANFKDFLRSGCPLA